ncbi:MAG: hypothetical protein QW343_04065, partial [Candidatus Norongarragalinales archaeon]
MKNSNAKIRGLLALTVFFALFLALLASLSKAEMQRKDLSPPFLYPEEGGSGGGGGGSGGGGGGSGGGGNTYSCSFDRTEYTLTSSLTSIDLFVVCRNNGVVVSCGGDSNVLKLENIQSVALDNKRREGSQFKATLRNQNAPTQEGGIVKYDYLNFHCSASVKTVSGSSVCIQNVESCRTRHLDGSEDKSLPLNELNTFKAVCFNAGGSQVNCPNHADRFTTMHNRNAGTTSNWRYDSSAAPKDYKVDYVLLSQEGDVLTTLLRCDNSNDVLPCSPAHISYSPGGQPRLERCEVSVADRVQRGSTAQALAACYDNNGNLMSCPNPVTWTVDSRIGSIQSPGNPVIFTATRSGSGDASGSVTATISNTGKTCSKTVTVYGSSSSPQDPQVSGFSPNYAYKNTEKEF